MGTDGISGLGADPANADASSLIPSEVALVGQQVQDGGPDTWEEVGPLVDQQLEVGVGRRVCCANCAGFCAAFGATFCFPHVFGGCSSPLPSALKTSAVVTAFSRMAYGGGF